MFRFTIRDVLWVMVVVGMAVGWYADRRATMLEIGKAYKAWHALGEAVLREGYVPEGSDTNVTLRRVR
jgi:hypothetical protein